ncbi:uncharacterized protein LOC109721518, partial [Ananas comosus]|uniref:Uncharacterized protein LOC109721518 n=1 Tax=Ananas comosus TaxID=4615 RepID=A0A6P5GAB1_ANACO
MDPTTSSTKKKPAANRKKLDTAVDDDDKEAPLSSCGCFFCAAREPDARVRRAALSAFFRAMPRSDDSSHVLVASFVWNLAMSDPDDPELPSAGALRCMALLIARALDDDAGPSWLRRHQNVYIPYYAAHVIGSYTIRVPSLAALAVEEGAVAPLLGLMRGSMTWVEQRVAVRALGHLASYDATYPAVARHADELVPLAMHIASACLGRVYAEFLAVSPPQRERYHRDLLTRGLGGAETENRKAEEWASQLQCWSLYLLSCFAFRDRRTHGLVCRDAEFLNDLCRMWGGVVNADSPAGAGLMRLLCRSRVGRCSIVACPRVVDSLCSLSRSSDDWQYMGIDCLLLLLDDPVTRLRAANIAAPCLVDLAELRCLGPRKNVGDAIARSLLQQQQQQLDNYDDTSPQNLSQEAELAIKNLWVLKIERKEREEAMSLDELGKRKALAALKKQEGNEKFYTGDLEGAMASYTEALELCPLKRRKDRVVLYSNRAQCRLLLREPDAAVSDATRALSLPRQANGHGKSLWRRSQAYDMKGMAKESLMDCLMFANRWWFEEKKGSGAKLPYYVVRMINKQMGAAWLFADAALRSKVVNKDGDVDGDGGGGG